MSGSHGNHLESSLLNSPIGPPSSCPRSSKHAVCSRLLWTGPWIKKVWHFKQICYWTITSHEHPKQNKFWNPCHVPINLPSGRWWCLLLEQTGCAGCGLLVSRPSSGLRALRQWPFAWIAGTLWDASNIETTLTSWRPCHVLRVSKAYRSKWKFELWSSSGQALTSAWMDCYFQMWVADI